MSEEKKRILIVEDEELLMKALVIKLNHEGFETLTALNGEEGLQVAFSEHPDLILLDIIMPKMDGLTMLKKLREDSWGKDASVVILTNLSDAESVMIAVQNHAYDFLVKSEWEIDDLAKKVKEKLKTQQEKT